MNTVLFVNAIIVFSENLFLVSVSLLEWLTLSLTIYKSLAIFTFYFCGNQYIVVILVY